MSRIKSNLILVGCLAFSLTASAVRAQQKVYYVITSSTSEPSKLARWILPCSPFAQ